MRKHKCPKCGEEFEPAPLSNAERVKEYRSRKNGVIKNVATQNITMTQKVTRPSDEAFAAFWSAYPRKVAKPAALRAWNKVKPSDDLVLTILADVERRKEGDQWRRDGGQFIPHPATYLNGARWEDEDVVATREAGGLFDSLKACAARAAADGTLDKEYEDYR